jgi:16S rRNA (cytosine967-C5)-methyltransferase
MRLGGRIAAAMEVLEEIFNRHTSAAAALHEWGRAHRFAGSGDRSAIGNFVYDALRRKNSIGSMMGSHNPRALVLGVARTSWEMSLADIDQAVSEKFGPGALTDREKTALKGVLADDAPTWVRGDFPTWLEPSFVEVFGDDAASQGAALACRAPVDLRVNTLKTTRENLLTEFAGHGALEGPLSPLSVRIPAPDKARRTPNVEIETAHGKGWFEVQDSASQVVALLAGAQPGDQVMDFCAGAGGKTLAIAAAMNNDGTVYAHDRDKRRLRPIFERITRSGADSIKVIGADETERFDELAGQMDIVLLDAPCSGAGSWRRKPDAKWRLSEATLEQRIKDQQAVLASGAKLVKPGGRLVYITCSVLPQENTAQVEAFLKQNSPFSLVPYRQIWQAVIGSMPPDSADGSKTTLLLTPYSHDTDGFFIAIMEKK